MDSPSDYNAWMDEDPDDEDLLDAFIRYLIEFVGG
jgi:hypothetical protein